MKLRAFRLVALVLLGVVLVVLACTPAEVAIVRAGVEGLDTTCREMLAQPEPAYVHFSCDVVDASGQVLSSFAVRAPQTDAAGFRAKMVRAPRRVAPLHDGG